LEKTSTEVIAEQGEYAILLVRSLSEEELHYKTGSPGVQYPDWEGSLLLPDPALEYGVAVQSFAPIVWQFIALYKVQNTEIKQTIEDAIEILHEGQ